MTSNPAPPTTLRVRLILTDQAGQGVQTSKGLKTQNGETVELPRDEALYLVETQRAAIVD